MTFYQVVESLFPLAPTTLALIRLPLPLQGVTTEIFLGLGLGFVCAVGVRNSLQKDLDAFSGVIFSHSLARTHTR